MKADYHMHTSFSGDSSTPPEEMIEQSISLGLTDICITDHQDMDFPKERYGVDFEFDGDEYFKTLLPLKEKYKDKINLHIGVELGLQPQLKNEYSEFLKKYPFDFAIGSIHLVNKTDPYYPEYYEGRSEYEAYMEYFEVALQNYKTFSEYDVLGHLDYIFRYGPDKNNFQFEYAEYGDILDTILKWVVENGKGLELNTAGFKAGLGHPNPHEDILKRYREFGGEIITIGADGHMPKHIAFDFYKVDNILTECGFKYYTIFENRKPVFKPINNE